MRRRVGDSEIVSYSMSHSLRVRRWSAIPCRTPWDTAAWHWTALACGAAALGFAELVAALCPFRLMRSNGCMHSCALHRACCFLHAFRVLPCRSMGD